MTSSSQMVTKPTLYYMLLQKVCIPLVAAYRLWIYVLSEIIKNVKGNL